MFTVMINGVPRKFDYINAVRGIAILMVITVHASNEVKGLPEAFTYMCSKGAFEVQLFFIASAFTLFLSYSKRKTIEGSHTTRNFFNRRFFRISPMYYLAAIVYSVICFYVPAYNDGQPLVLWKVLANMLYLNGFIPGAINYLPPGGWSVGVEMVFYCCVPFLFAEVKNFKNAVVWVVVLTVVAVALKLLIRFLLIRLSIDYHRPENWFLYYWFPNQAPVFMVGIALFFGMQKYTVTGRVTVYVSIALNTLALFIFTWYRRHIDPYNIIPEQTIVAIFLAVNIFFLSQCRVRLFDNAITRFLGEISFSLYLVHFIVVYVLVDYFPHPANPFAWFFELLGLTILISSAISWFTYHYIELNGIKLGNKYTRPAPVNVSAN